MKIHARKNEHKICTNPPNKKISWPPLPPPLCPSLSSLFFPFSMLSSTLLLLSQFFFPFSCRYCCCSVPFLILFTLCRYCCCYSPIPSSLFTCRYCCCYCPIPSSLFTLCLYCCCYWPILLPMLSLICCYCPIVYMLSLLLLLLLHPFFPVYMLCCCCYCPIPSSLFTCCRHSCCYSPIPSSLFTCCRYCCCSCPTLLLLFLSHSFFPLYMLSYCLVFVLFFLFSCC